MPAEFLHEIHFFPGKTNDFSSIRSRIGESCWKTSMFPDKASGCYVLPIKAWVREDEGNSTGDRIGVEIVIGRYRGAM